MAKVRKNSSATPVPPSWIRCDKNLMEEPPRRGDHYQMIQKILFPVDFSPSCAAMAAYVERAAAIFGAQVTIIHVCDLSSHNGFELYARPGNDIAKEHWNLARHKIELFLTTEFPTEKSPRVLLPGNAANMITNTARRNRFDLIMMPTHAGRFRRMLLGSTTAKVLNASDCPVLTAQHAAAMAPRPLEHRKWVCALALSPDSERVLRYAKSVALAAGADLSLIHVIEDSKAQSKTRRRSDGERKALQRIAELQSSVGSEARVSIVVGPVKETLLAQVRETYADVLVIGRSRRGSLGHFEDLDLTYSLVRDSPCPVVSV